MRTRRRDFQIIHGRLFAGVGFGFETEDVSFARDNVCGLAARESERLSLAKERFEITSTMKNAYDFNSVIEWTVESQEVAEAMDGPDAEWGEGFLGWVIDLASIAIGS